MEQRLTGYTTKGWELEFDFFRMGPHPTPLTYPDVIEAEPIDQYQGDPNIS